MSLAVFGVLAAIVAFSVAQTGVAQAHPCDQATFEEQAACDTEHDNAGLDHTDPTHDHMEPVDPPPAPGGTIDIEASGFPSGSYIFTENIMINGMSVLDVVSSGRHDGSATFSEHIDVGDDGTFTAEITLPELDDGMHTLTIYSCTGVYLDKVKQYPHDASSDDQCTAVMGGGVVNGMSSTEVTLPAGDDAIMVMGMPVASASVESSFQQCQLHVELKLTIDNLAMDVAVGGSIVLYLEDDFAEPEDISASDVYFVSEEPKRVTTGNGGRVYTSVDPVVSTSDYFDADKDDVAIQVFVPDMCPNATDTCEGDDGLVMGDKITMVLTKRASVKNPSEEGTHSTRLHRAVGNLYGLGPRHG